MSRVTCADGFAISIHVGSYSFCEPRSNNAKAYQSLELAFPNRPCTFIKDYAGFSRDYSLTVYGYVPARVVRKMLDAHGGIVSGECPPLDIGV